MALAPLTRLAALDVAPAVHGALPLPGLLEEVVAEVVAAVGLAELFEGLAGRVVELRGDPQVDGDDQVALGAVAAGRALAADAQLGAVAGAGRDLERDGRSLVGRYGDVRA